LKISDLFTKVDKLTAGEAKEMMDKKGQDGIILLDVREPVEYQAGHIPGARFVPLSAFPDHLNKPDLSKTVITYCKRGPRSKSAAALLKRQGHEDVYYMDGGIDAWNGLVSTGPYETGLFLLEGRKTPEELVMLAWSLEDGTGLFYTRMLDLSKDEEARQVIQSLIKAEQSHKSKLLEAYRQIKGIEITDEAILTQSVRGYIEGGVSVDEVVGWIKKENSALQDILEISMQIETNSLDLYMKMHTEVEDELAKKVFNILIEEEKIHLSILGKLLGSKITV
jgi:rhodanese-related sulfurtransferase/rubrerythrin